MQHLFRLMFSLERLGFYNSAFFLRQIPCYSAIVPSLSVLVWISLCNMQICQLSLSCLLNIEKDKLLRCYTSTVHLIWFPVIQRTGFVTLYRPYNLSLPSYCKTGLRYPDWQSCITLSAMWNKVRKINVRIERMTGEGLKTKLKGFVWH